MKNFVKKLLGLRAVFMSPEVPDATPATPLEAAMPMEGGKGPKAPKNPEQPPPPPPENPNEPVPSPNPVPGAPEQPGPPPGPPKGQPGPEPAATAEQSETETETVPDMKDKKNRLRFYAEAQQFIDALPNTKRKQAEELQRLHGLATSAEASAEEREAANPERPALKLYFAVEEVKKTA